MPASHSKWDGPNSETVLIPELARSFFGWTVQALSETYLFTSQVASAKLPHIVLPKST